MNEQGQTKNLDNTIYDEDVRYIINVMGVPVREQVHEWVLKDRLRIVRFLLDDIFKPGDLQYADDMLTDIEAVLMSYDDEDEEES